MGTRLKERRVDLGLTLSEAARRAGVSTSYLSAVESGASTASLPVLSRVAHALDVTIGELLAAETASTVQRSHLDASPGITSASSHALRLRVAFHSAEVGETGACPLDVSQNSVVAYVHSGRLDVTVDGELWHLDQGDSLHAQSPAEVTWATPVSATTVVWAAAPEEGA